MLKPGRLKATRAEHKAVDELIRAHPEEAVSMTRRDPGEKVPLLVHVGDKTFEVTRAGKKKQV